jgi:hypothetical protein
MRATRMICAFPSALQQLQRAGRLGQVAAAAGAGTPGGRGSAAADPGVVQAEQEHVLPVAVNGK